MTTITLSLTSGVPGTTVTVTGDAFARKQRGSVAFDGVTVAAFSANPHGDFSTSFVVPSSTSVGSHTVSATTATATFSVVATPTPSPTPTPTSDVGTFAGNLGFGTLIMADEFDGAAGTKPDANIWAAKQYTTTSGVYWNGLNNVSLDGQSHLDIAAIRGSSGWLSAEIAGTHSYQGARFLVARAKMPAGLGAWPAPIWEVDFPYGALGIELDVCEQLAKEPTGYHTTVHARTGDPQVSVYNDTGVNLAAGFHDYGCAVHDDHADFYFDGNLIHTITKTQLGSWEFNSTPRCLMIDLDMGGWGGTIDSSLTSQHMLVDFIRVYQ